MTDLLSKLRKIEEAKKEQELSLRLEQGFKTKMAKTIEPSLRNSNNIVAIIDAVCMFVSTEPEFASRSIEIQTYVALEYFDNYCKDNGIDHPSIVKSMTMVDGVPLIQREKCDLLYQLASHFLNSYGNVKSFVRDGTIKIKGKK